MAAATSRRHGVSLQPNKSRQTPSNCRLATARYTRTQPASAGARMRDENGAAHRVLFVGAHTIAACFRLQGPAPLAAWIRAKAKELGGYNDAEIDDMSSA